MSNDIRESVAVSETIKEAAELSRQVYLRSLNAMLTARHTGNGAPGFVAVTGQLRRFSSDLEKATRNLLDAVALLVERATEVQRQRQRTSLAEQALGGSGPYCGNNAVMGFRSRISTASRRCESAVIAAREGVRRELKSVLQQCMTGNSLAVLAKIEAGNSADLLTVAGETGQLVDAIQERMNRLDHLLDHERRRAA